MKKSLFTFGLFALLLLGVDAHAAGEKVLIDRLVANGVASKEEAKKQLDTVIESIKAELQEGNSITIRNFGRFHVAEREARQGRNPRTGEALAIPAKRYPRFSSSESFKKEMNPAAVATKVEAQAKAEEVDNTEVE
jgi:DNA-binding protein HU-beta